ncbi:phage major capsid protein [Mycobacterium alsense]|uniref:phage major capsid protein n=1 Tax=Mycobacterium alsense TaxID=324058 RepID=UPI001FD55DDC|nr:phage major capsid protein [Mycobacterium alsense]
MSGDVEGDEPSLHVAYVVDQLDAEYVAENTAGTENPPGLDEVEIKTKKLYRLVNLSFEQWQQDETAAAVANSVSTDLIAKADASFLGENTSPLIGLLNAPDVIVGTQVANSLDNLVDLIATLEANRSKPSHIIVDPMSWAALRKLKVGTAYNASLLGAGTHDSQPMLLDLPVVRSPFVPAGTGVVVDATAIASALGPVRIATSEHALFAQDAIQIRATWRIGWKVMRPTRIGRFTVAGAGGS